jgi:hypothetical protein
MRDKVELDIYYMKYALTSGVVKLKVVDYGSSSFFQRGICSHIFIKDCALTIEYAKLKFDSLKSKKIASLENKRDKLQKLEFSFRDETK